MTPSKFYKCLSDDTRLKSLLLISKTGEACVCELMEALELDQPKISRHLAELRKCGILIDDRRGKWVYYKLHPDLNQWAVTVITETVEANSAYFASELERFESSRLSTNLCR